MEHKDPAARTRSANDQKENTDFVVVVVVVVDEHAAQHTATATKLSPFCDQQHTQGHVQWSSGGGGGGECSSGTLAIFFLFGDPLTTRRASDAIGSPWRIKRAIDRPVRSRTLPFRVVVAAVVVCSHQRRGLVVGVSIYVQAKG